MTREQLDQILRPEVLTKPHYSTVHKPIERTMRLLALICLLAAAPAFSQGYPSKPVRIIVPFPAGGIADLYARIIGAKVQRVAGASRW